MAEDLTRFVVSNKEMKFNESLCPNPNKMYKTLQAAINSSQPNEIIYEVQMRLVALGKVEQPLKKLVPTA